MIRPFDRLARGTSCLVVGALFLAGPLAAQKPAAHCTATLGGAAASGQALQAGGPCTLNIVSAAGVTSITLEASSDDNPGLVIGRLSSGTIKGATLALTSGIQLSGAAKTGRWTEKTAAGSGITVVMTAGNAVGEWSESGPNGGTGTFTLTITSLKLAEGDAGGAYGSYVAHGTLVASLASQSAVPNGHDLQVNVTF